MLININDNDYENISEMATALETTPEELLIKQVKVNSSIYNIPIPERKNFIQFIYNFTNILDDFSFLSDETVAYLSQVDSSGAMQRVFQNFGPIIEEDLNFLYKLYEVYIEKDVTS